MTERASSRLTSKYQATIPAEVRAALQLKAGDRVSFEIRDSGTVTLRRETPADRAYLSATSDTLASEWLSDEDDDAYRAL